MSKPGRIILCVCTAALFFCARIFAAETPGSALPETRDAKSSAAKNDISFTDSVILGFVEGITEFLPVSSTGHLIITNHFLGLNSDIPLKDSDGNTVYTIKNGEKKPYTINNAANAYCIIIQLGAIAAVAFIYRKSLLRMLKGLLGKDPAGLKLLVNIVAAFMPAALIGITFNDLIESVLFGVYPVIFALFAGGVLMLFAQKWYDNKKAAHNSTDTDMYDMSIKQALTVGILQCVAMWPGTSRSMMTILGGYFAGLKPAQAAQFSFLLGLVTLGAACFFKIVKEGANISQGISLVPLAVGLAVAFVSAALSVKWLVAFLTKHGLAPFAWYRFVLAALLLALLVF